MMMIVVMMMIASYTNDDDSHRDDDRIVHKWWWSSSSWPHRTLVMMFASYIHWLIRCDLFRWRTDGRTNKGILGVGWMLQKVTAKEKKSCPAHSTLWRQTKVLWQTGLQPCCLLIWEMYSHLNRWDSIVILIWLGVPAADDARLKIYFSKTASCW